MVVLRDAAQMEARFSSFGDCANLYSRDRCTVCAERTINLEIILTHQMELLGDVEPCFGPFADSVSIDVR
jgi:hypothetical protein